MDRPHCPHYNTCNTRVFIMAQTKSGAEIIAAKKCGVTVEQYRMRIAGGEKHCRRCRKWKTHDCYGKDSTRYDGLAAICIVCRSEDAKGRRVPKPRVSKLGQRFTPIRPQDKKQARYRVNHLVKIGRLANPNLLPCFDCGHTGSDKRHEYDHFEGYSAEKQECVQVACSTCHAKRARDRGEIVQTKDRIGRFTKKGGSANGS